MTLFRREAAQFRQSKFYGDILVTRRLSSWLLTLLACVFTAFVIAFLALGSYTQKQRVTGVLVPDKGIIVVFSPEVGTVSSLAVKEGDRVEQGQLLYTLNRDVVTADGHRSRVAIQEGLSAQQVSLAAAEQRQLVINSDAEESMRRKVAGMERERDQLGDSQKLVELEDGLLTSDLQRFETLSKQGLVTEVQLQEKRLAQLGNRAKRLELERSRTVLEREIQVTSQDLAAAKLRGENELALIVRSEHGMQQNMLENAAQRELRIEAPTAGLVTGILVKPGQMVGTQALLSIVPAGATLQAELYAPSNAVGFIKPGNAVLVRYRAFPYQKFGQQRAAVTLISRAAIGSVDPNPKPSTLSPGSAGSLYRITVRLPKQSVLAYGKDEPLQPGMELDADILLDRRHLYEWLLEPLYSVTGQV